MRISGNNHQQWMELAIAEAEKALADGEFPVGCVIVCENRLLTAGSRLNSRSPACELDHAEIVALRHCLRCHPQVPRERLLVYSTMEPCLMCTGTLLVNGIQQIVYGYEDVMGGAMNLPLAQLAPLYASRRLAVIGGVLRRQCLQIFQQFFASPQSVYLHGSLLAHYTLRQPA